MCGRFSLLTSTKRLNARFGVLFESSAVGRRNIKPSAQIPTVVLDSGRRSGELMRWGLIPRWAKDERAGYKMINARAETVLEKPSYRGLVKDAAQRCLIVADGFYEWMKAEDPKQRKQPFRFSLPEDEPFAFAGLWTTWDPRAGGPIRSCTIITTTPSREVAPIHDRMPVVLDGEEQEAAWLDQSADGQAASELLKPLRDGRLVVEPAENL